MFGGIRTAEKGEEVAPKKVARQIRSPAEVGAGRRRAKVLRD